VVDRPPLMGINVESDGSIVVGRITGTGFRLIRYQSDGRPAPDVGQGGVREFRGSLPVVLRQAVLVRTNGELYSAYGGGNEWIVIHQDAAGLRDQDFGGSGHAEVTMPNGGLVGSTVANILVQPDGKVVVGGTSGGTQPHLPGTLAPTSVDSVQFAIARLEIDGTADASFAQNGLARTDVAPGRDIANALLLQPDGKLVLLGGTGSMTPGPEDNDFAVVRYEPDGALDQTFGTNGQWDSHILDGPGWATAGAILPDGEILILGRVSETLVLVRLTEDGAMDESFGDGGTVVLGMPGALGASDTGGFGVAVAPDGRFLLSISDALRRYLPDGTVDESFGDGGLVSLAER